jgi:hypothetical protein
MIKDELHHILHGERDSVDDQFSKNLALIAGRSVKYLAPLPRGRRSPSAASLAATVLWAYYRSVYHQQSGFGGLMLVLPTVDASYRTAALIAAFLGLRDQEPEITLAHRVCPALRESKDAVTFAKTRIICGLPFSGLMSWDINNLASSCNMAESLVITTERPDTWSISATKKGEVVRMESLVGEVFSLADAFEEIKRS